MSLWWRWCWGPSTRQTGVCGTSFCVHKSQHKQEACQHFKGFLSCNCRKWDCCQWPYLKWHKSVGHSLFPVSGVANRPVSSLNNTTHFTFLQPCSPHLSSLNIRARLWSSCQPVIVCHKTEPSLSLLTRARLEHQALTSKRGISSRKEVHVANQALICGDLLSWSDHIKTPPLPASCVHCWGPETRAGKGRTGMSLLFRQVVIIPLKFFQIRLVRFHGFDQCPLILWNNCSVWGDTL